MISVKNLSICLLYGMLSTFQTLNSRYLFRTLGFDFYTFVLAYIIVGISRATLVEHCSVHGNIKSQDQVGCSQNHNSLLFVHVYNEYPVVVLCNCTTLGCLYGLQEVHSVFHSANCHFLQTAS
jgi:hypothetical protein